MEKLTLEPQRQQRFLELAVDRALLRQEEILGELLRDGRAALRDGAVQDVGDESAPDAEGVDAVMFVKAAVLDGDECLRHVAGHFPQRQRRAGEIATARERAPLYVDDLDRRLPLRNFQRLDRWQMCADPGDEADAADGEPQADHQAPVGNAAEARPMPRAGRFLRARRLRGFAGDAPSDAGAARSPAVTRSSGPSSSSSNAGSRRARAAFFFAAIRNPSRAGGSMAPAPGYGRRVDLRAR